MKFLSRVRIIHFGMDNLNKIKASMFNRLINSDKFYFNNCIYLKDDYLAHMHVPEIHINVHYKVTINGINDLIKNGIVVEKN